MSRALAEYRDIRDKVQFGDIIAFGGKGTLSNAIKAFTRSPVSHIGIAMPWFPQLDRLMLIESTTLHDDRKGVQMNSVSAYVCESQAGGNARRGTRENPAEETYDLWWLPLRQDVRDEMDETVALEWLVAQLGKPYDFAQAAGSAFDFFDDLWMDNDEDFSKFFCSELAAGYMKRAIPPVFLPDGFNASEQTPMDVCLLGLYAGIVQFQGTSKTIPGASLRTA